MLVEEAAQLVEDFYERLLELVQEEQVRGGPDAAVTLLASTINTATDHGTTLIMRATDMGFVKVQTVDADTVSQVREYLEGVRENFFKNQLGIVAAAKGEAKQ